MPSASSVVPSCSSWPFDALSNLCEMGNVTAEQKAAVEAELAALQQIAYDAYAAMQADPAGATAISMQTAETVHVKVVELVNGLIAQ